jgi:hypothetical protein
LFYPWSEYPSACKPHHIRAIPAIREIRDAGVPIKAAVAGISVGLVTEFDGSNLNRYTLLSDIIGKPPPKPRECVTRYAVL